MRWSYIYDNIFPWNCIQSNIHNDLLPILNGAEVGDSCTLERKKIQQISWNSSKSSNVHYYVTCLFFNVVGWLNISPRTTSLIKNPMHIYELRVIYLCIKKWGSCRSSNYQPQNTNKFATNWHSTKIKCNDQTYKHNR